MTKSLENVERLRACNACTPVCKCILFAVQGPSTPYTITGSQNQLRYKVRTALTVSNQLQNNEHICWAIHGKGLLLVLTFMTISIGMSKTSLFTVQQYVHSTFPSLNPRFCMPFSPAIPSLFNSVCLFAKPLFILLTPVGSVPCCCCCGPSVAPLL